MATKTQEPRPDTKAPFIQEMQDAAKLGRTLMGGTNAMQAEGEDYLPRHPNEYEDSYEFRLKTSRLRNFFRRTVVNTVGKLFAKPFTIEDESSTITNVIKNVDRSGNDIQAFTRDLVKDALSHAGVSFFLVDRLRKRAANAGEEQSGANAPFWTHISLDDLLDIQFTKAPDLEVTHLRFYQTVTRPVDRFTSETKLQIKVIEPDQWEIYEKQKPQGQSKERWVVVESGVNTLDKVCLVPLYLNRTASFQAEPPLEDLADMNLEHWQLRSEQRRTVQINSFPILGVFNTEADTSELVVGPESILKVTGENADARFLESGGGHMQSAREELKDLEEHMRAFGSQFETAESQSAMETASGRVIDADEASSVLHLWALSMKDSVELGLLYTTMWLDANESDAGTVRMDMKFGGRVLSDAQVERLMKLRQLGDLSREGLLMLMKKSGDLPEDFDIEEDADKLDEDDPDDLIPPSGNPDDPDDDDDPPEGDEGDDE